MQAREEADRRRQVQTHRGRQEQGCRCVKHVGAGVQRKARGEADGRGRAEAGRQGRQAGTGRSRTYTRCTQRGDTGQGVGVQAGHIPTLSAVHPWAWVQRCICREVGGLMHNPHGATRAQAPLLDYRIGELQKV